jgi:hypothetical protein
MGHGQHHTVARRGGRRARMAVERRGMANSVPAVALLGGARASAA